MAGFRTCCCTSAPRCLHSLLYRSNRGVNRTDYSPNPVALADIPSRPFEFQLPITPNLAQPQHAFPYFLHKTRVRRKRQRLPSSLVIENPRQQTSGFHLNMVRRGFPMNASDYTSSPIGEGSSIFWRNL